MYIHWPAKKINSSLLTRLSSALLRWVCLRRPIAIFLYVLLQLLLLLLKFEIVPQSQIFWSFSSRKIWAMGRERESILHWSNWHLLVVVFLFFLWSCWRGISTVVILHSALISSRQQWIVIYFRLNSFQN